MKPDRPAHWPLMPPAPGEEDEDPPPIPTTYLLFTAVLGVGVTPFLKLPPGLLLLAAGSGLVAGFIWHFGGRIAAGIAFIVLTQFAADFLRPALNRTDGAITAGLLALLPGMATFSAVLLFVRFAEAGAERQESP